VSVLAEVQSQRRTYRVGWLDSGRATAQYQDLVKQALVGYPRDVTFEYRSADGQAARLQEFATELVQLKVDVMFAVGDGAILAARQATSTIPIVMVGSDAARPDDSSANVTGVTYSSAELARRWVSLLKEIRPLSRVAVVYGADSASRAELATLQAAASDAGATIQAYGVNEGDALGGLFARPSAERAEAIIVPGGPTTLAHLSRIVDLAGRARVPTIYGSSEFVEAGGLLSYGPSTPAMYRRAGGYIGKILSPTNPRDLPIEQPSRFELVVNLKTARALGLTLPSSLVLRADRVF
jgi:putative tryptophan/tyrosine transport system substrate-binding protein